MSEIKLLPCPICSREIDIEKNLYIPERDWKPTFYDPDSGGDPINIHCECGLEFSTGTYDMSEFEKHWNTRKPMERILQKLEHKIFSAEVYNDDFDGTQIENLLCLGDVTYVLMEEGGIE